MKKLALSLCFATALSMMLFVPQAEAARCPTSCISWFDGCNTCVCKNGRTTICTKKACKRLAPKRCLKRKPKCPTCRTMRCKSGYTCKNLRGCGKCVRKPRPKTCPKNCSKWSDGCNVCSCVNGRIRSCTRRACKTYKKPRCLKRKCPTCRTMRCRSGYSCRNIKGCGLCVRKPRPKTCPRNCKTWYDGCNKCSCKNGRIGACTKRACKRYSKPRCVQTNCTTCRTMKCGKGYTCKNIRGCGKCLRLPKVTRACSGGCKVWYDGCNTCQCRNGKIAACTKRACFRKGRAYCKKR